MNKKSNRLLASVLVVQLCLGQAPFVFAQQPQSAPVTEAGLYAKLAQMQTNLSPYLSISRSTESDHAFDLVSKDDRLLPSVYDYRVNLDSEAAWFEVYNKGTQRLVTSVKFQVEESDFQTKTAGELVRNFGSKLKTVATMLVKSQKLAGERRAALDLGAEQRVSALKSAIFGAILYSVATVGFVKGPQAATLTGRLLKTSMFYLLLVGGTYLLGQSFGYMEGAPDADFIGARIAERQEQLEAANVDPEALLKAMAIQSEEDFKSVSFKQTLHSQVGGTVVIGLISYMVAIMPSMFGDRMTLGRWASALTLGLVAPVALAYLWLKNAEEPGTKSYMGVPNSKTLSEKVDADFDVVLAKAIAGERQPEFRWSQKPR